MYIRRLIFLLVITGIVLTIGIVYVRFTPNLVSVSPQPGEIDVLGAHPVQLTFSRAMQIETVVERLSFTPAMKGEFTWEENTLIFTPNQPWFSGEKVTVQLKPGARSTGLIQLSLRDQHEWTFTIGPPLLLYWSPMEGLSNLFAYNLVSGETTQLTYRSSGVLDFSASPDGRIIYFSERNQTGGSDIFMLDRLGDAMGQPDIERLLACLHTFCHSPQVSSDGSLLAYEREPRPKSGQPLYSQVWLLELLQNNETEPNEPLHTPASEAGHASRSPTWSSTGWLSYYDLKLQAFVLLDTNSGERLEFKNQTGEPGTWTPNGDAFIAPEIIFTPPASPEEEYSQLAASHMMRFDIASGEIHNLSQEIVIEDTFPSFSPNGSTLAFTRKFLDEVRWTPGRQIWLIDVASGESRSLTDSPSFNHSGIAWSPEGDKLAYLRFNLDRLTEPGELWLVDLDTNEHFQITTGGYSPLWIP